MVFYPRLLNFWRGDFNDLTGLWTAPKSGRGDFVETLIRLIAQNENLALDAYGNEMSLEE